MRLLLIAVSLSLMLTIHAHESAGAIDDRKSQPAWKLSDEERLARRFDPQSMKERRAKEATEPFGFKRETDAAKDDTTNVIVGARNPELLMPWELFNHLMNTTNLPEEDHRDGWRRIYEERATALEIPADFWQRLDRVTESYRALIASRWEAEALLNNDDRGDDSAAIARLQDIEKASCSERARALERARLELGREWFDRFLYTAPARSLTVVSNDETPAEHRRISGGCR
ncbi:MAG TPA: hypothetical protein VF618_00980 [Thermoanaerobaculia bacterium]